MEGIFVFRIICCLESLRKNLGSLRVAVVAFHILSQAARKSQVAILMYELEVFQCGCLTDHTGCLLAAQLGFDWNKCIWPLWGLCSLCAKSKHPNQAQRKRHYLLQPTLRSYTAALAHIIPGPPRFKQQGCRPPSLSDWSSNTTL